MVYMGTVLLPFIFLTGQSNRAIVSKYNIFALVSSCGCFVSVLLSQ